jgi:hypothetical protein
MTRGNSTINLDLVNAIYAPSSVGFTGATGATSTIGATGDIIVSVQNDHVYQYDGTFWNLIYDKVDAFEIPTVGSTATDNFKNIAKYLNQILPQDGLIHPYLSDFIYYYNEDYDYNYDLVPYIRAVSKGFDKNLRHRIKYDGFVGTTASYDTVNFGYMGDIPTHFEIYSINPTGPSGSILISGMTSAYFIGSTNLRDLANELNGPTAQSTFGIKNFTYTLIQGASGWVGPTSLPATISNDIKIQAISKAFTSPEEIIINYTGNIIGNVYGRSIIKNPTWDDIRVLKYTEELPLLTVVNFTYDPSKMWGKTNPVWILTKEGDSNFPDIYFRNKYFSYLFNQKGSYTLTLQLSDTNGNTQTVTKREIIKIV